MKALIFFICGAILSVEACKMVKLTCNNIRAFVNAHNDVRLRLAKGLIPKQPPAATMTYLIWDDELEKQSLEWVETTADEDWDEFVYNFPSVGVNIHTYYTRSFQINPYYAVEAWAAESLYYEYSHHPRMRPEKNETDLNTDRYTQMIWQHTNKMACVVNRVRARDTNKVQIFCFYEPRGNTPGKFPYTNGKSDGRLVCGTTNCAFRYGKRCTQ